MHKEPGWMVASLLKMYLQVSESTMQVMHLKPESRRLCPEGFMSQGVPSLGDRAGSRQSSGPAPGGGRLGWKQPVRIPAILRVQKWLAQNTNSYTEQSPSTLQLERWVPKADLTQPSVLPSPRGLSTLPSGFENKAGYETCGLASAFSAPCCPCSPSPPPGLLCAMLSPSPERPRPHTSGSTPGSLSPSRLQDPLRGPQPPLTPLFCSRTPGPAPSLPVSQLRPFTHCAMTW